MYNVCVCVHECVKTDGNVMSGFRINELNAFKHLKKNKIANSYSVHKYVDINKYNKYNNKKNKGTRGSFSSACSQLLEIVVEPL